MKFGIREHGNSGIPESEKYGIQELQKSGTDEFTTPSIHEFRILNPGSREFGNLGFQTVKNARIHESLKFETSGIRKLMTS